SGQRIPQSLCVDDLSKKSRLGRGGDESAHLASRTTARMLRCRIESEILPNHPRLMRPRGPVVHALPTWISIQSLRLHDHSARAFDSRTWLLSLDGTNSQKLQKEHSQNLVHERQTPADRRRSK